MKKIFILLTFILLILSCKKENKLPTANAGSDQSILEGATVNLDGTASKDPDGNALTYLWTAPQGITLSSTTDALPTFTAPEVSIETTYTFTLVVNDGEANSLVDEVVISCKQVNKLPTANAGNDQSIKEGATVTLDGSASKDPNGDALTYLWTAPQGITLSSTTDAHPTFTTSEVSTETSYTFTLVVNDGEVNSLVDEVVIKIEHVYKYLPYITAGQTDGVGIKYVDFEPDAKLVDFWGDGNYSYYRAQLFLDLNNDSIDDFEMIFNYPPGRGSVADRNSIIIPLSNNSVCISKTGWIEPFASGDTIGRNNNWSNSQAYLFTYHYYNTMSPDGPLRSETFDGYFYNSDKIFMGVKILKDGKELFGWMDIHIDVYNYSEVIRRYAVSKPY